MEKRTIQLKIKLNQKEASQLEQMANYYESTKSALIRSYIKAMYSDYTDLMCEISDREEYQRAEIEAYAKLEKYQ